MSELGTQKHKNLHIQNVYSLGSTTIDMKDPVNIASSASQIRFADGIEIGSSGTISATTNAIAIGRPSVDCPATLVMRPAILPLAMTR